MNNRRNKNDKKRGKPGPVPDCLNDAVKCYLDKFLSDENETELKLPSFLSSQERAFIHSKVLSLGLKSKSRGKGMNRYLTVYKRAGSTIIQKDAKLTLDAQMRHEIAALTEAFPLTSKEREDLSSSCTDKDRNIQTSHKAMGHLSSGIAQVPTTTYNPDLVQFRNNLPVYAQRREIVEAIFNNQVVVIAGETGSGKTTQIPQLVMEQCQLEGKPCRIYCSQPRRMSAVSVAERVAYERNDKLGQTVGYQIRLESRISPRTILAFCTTGVLLRTLMSGDNVLTNVTHVFVDEVHERDKFVDFLLIALKENLVKYKDLKVILMSATIDVQIFSKYFENCAVITIPGRMYEVQKFYLEDVLSLLNYKTEAMTAVEKKLYRENSGKRSIVAGKTDVPNNEAPKNDPTPSEVSIDPDTQKDMDDFLMDCYSDGSLDSFAQILYMYLSEGVPVDCKHSESGMTGLMAAAHQGLLETAQQILQIGGDILTRDKKGRTAYNYAAESDKTECASFLKSAEADIGLVIDKETGLENYVSSDDNPNLKLYHMSVADETVDHDIIISLVKYIHTTQPKGSILIFLPGYDDIITQKDKILTCSELSSIKYQIFTLHSNMQSNDQKKVFHPLPGFRKIILSTNIAETSITIDDVVYVIDSCKVKEKYYESSAGISSLQCVWTSKSCIKQRAGRAGRTQPGKCFILCSKTKFNDILPENSTPEILRVPLQELCLHTKLLTSHNVPITDFLLKALEPPSLTAVRNSVALLKTIGALTPMEDLTEIGHHLLNLSVEPKLGKMLLYACVLKCLDPVLTIVSSLSYKEPFQLPSVPELRKLSKASRKAFSSNALSDHMALLRAFQGWQLAKSNGTDRAFCSKNFICGPTMEMIVLSRGQLLSQLRALEFVKPRGPGDIKDINSNSEKWYVIKAVLVSGLYPSLARIDRDSMSLRTSKEVKVAFHPSSTLHSSEGRAASMQKIAELPSDWLVFEEISRIGRFCFLRCNTLITPLTVALFAGPLRLPAEAVTQKANYQGLSSDSDSENDDMSATDISCLMIDDWAIFSATSADALNIYSLRNRFSTLMIKKMNYPGKNSIPLDDCVLKTVVNVLAYEEKSVGLHQPSGIGQRPRNMPLDYQSPRTRNDDLLYGNPAGHHNFMANNYYPPNQYFNQRMPHQQGYAMQNVFNQQSFQQNSMRNVNSPCGSNPLLANIEKYSDCGDADARYFIIKVDQSDVAVRESQSNGCWTFNYHAEKKLLKTVRAGTKAILFFSTPSSYVGCASLSPENLRNDQDSPYTYPIEWISTQNLPHGTTRHLLNALNENRKVYASRDGQEISTDSAKKLFTLLRQPPKRQQRNNGNRPLQKQNTG